MEEKKVVSISLLTAGKKKELERCLLSLQPIMQEIPCELIIVDTGCDKASRTLVEQYATQIVNFTWCNDFSKARNAGLEKASGEWFLYLDDDEWFDDLTEVVQFFKTGEYRQYEYAIYKQRNYADYEGKTYSDAPAGRMIRLKKDTHFIYSIHECFNDVGDKIKYFNTFVHHYGYVYRNAEEQMLHAQRNISLLTQEHEREPWNLRHTLQLMLEYRASEGYDQAVALGLDTVRSLKHPDDQQVYYNNSIMVLIIQILAKQQYFDRMINVGETFCENQYISLLSIAYIKAMLSYAYREKEQYQKSIACVKSYLHYRNHYMQDSPLFLPFETPVTSNCFSDEMVRATLENGIMSAIAANDPKNATEWNTMIGWEKGSFSVSGKLLNDIISVLKDAGWQNYIVDLFRPMLVRKEIVKYICEQIEAIIPDLSDEKLENLQKGYAIIRNMISELYPKKNAQTVEQEEFALLAKQIKQRVCGMLEAGQKQEALQILLQLQKMIPQDKEVKDLLGGINYRD